MDADALPFLGVGLGWRAPLDGFLVENPGLVDFVELMPEHVLDAPASRRQPLLQRIARFPVVAHGVSANLGSADGPDEAYLRGMRDVARRARAAWASDHLAFTGIGGRHVGELVPIPCTSEALDVATRNVRRAQRIVGLPFAVENVSRYFSYGDEEMSEPEFLRRLAARTGCWLLLDVTNAWNNARNLGLDAQRHLAEYPLERVVHVHLGGAHEDPDGGVLDTHAAPVPEPVWGLLDVVLAKAPVKALVLERDGAFGEHALLAAELRRARAALEARG